jgi:hypothetical protein
MSWKISGGDSVNVEKEKKNMFWLIYVCEFAGFSA